MTEESADKLQILLKGGSHEEIYDSVESWLNFLTDPTNLKPGLPDLNIAVGEWYVFLIHVKFDKIKASISYLKLELGSFDDSEIAKFRNPNPPDSIPNGATNDTSNPYHLHQWVFGIFNQTELQSLEIPFLTPELPDLFDNLSKLKYVSFKDSKLLRLPPSFYKLPALNELDITGSPFSELPAQLATLPSLRKLSFDQPFEASIFKNLSNLEELHCSSKDLNVPIEITNLINLRSLHLSSVATAPENLLNFPKLQSFHLHISKFSKLRFSSGNMPSLTELNTSNLEIFSIALRDFMNLQNLVASGRIYPSDMEPLKASFTHLEKLTRLSLNKLQFFNEQKGLFYAKYHDLEFFASLKSLEYLNLNENGLSKMPLLINLPHLKELHLKHNDISEFRELPSSLQYIDLSKNQFISFGTDLSYLNNAKTLLLNNNRIVSFGILPPSLEHLNLEENQIAQITTGLNNLIQLKTISLSDNLLTEVPHLPANLVEVDLSKNKITQMPLGLSKLQKLKILKLNNNPLTDIPELAAMPSLERIELAHTNLPESEYVAAPTDELMAKLKLTFPNATYCF